jgi:hypothetical protein
LLDIECDLDGLADVAGIGAALAALAIPAACSSRSRISQIWNFSVASSIAGTMGAFLSPPHTLRSAMKSSRKIAPWVSLKMNSVLAVLGI